MREEDDAIAFYAQTTDPKLNLNMRNLGDEVTVKLTLAMQEVGRSFYRMASSHAVA